LLVLAPELASSDNTSQHVFWFAIFFFAVQLHKPQCFIIIIIMLVYFLNNKAGKLRRGMGAVLLTMFHLLNMASSLGFFGLVLTER
jgi:hypothetical protein